MALKGRLEGRNFVIIFFISEVLDLLIFAHSLRCVDAVGAVILLERAIYFLPLFVCLKQHI